MGLVLAQARRWFVDGPLRDPQLAHATPADIQAVLEHKRSKGVSARTANLYRANLHRLFQLCVRLWLLIPTNPVAATAPVRQAQLQRFVRSRRPEPRENRERRRNTPGRECGV
jgi:hypothetical protein